MPLAEKDFEFLPAERLPTEMVPVGKVDSRRELIFEMLTKGKSKHDMIQEVLALKHPDIISLQDAAREIKNVYISEEISQQTHQKFVLNLHVERYEKMYSMEIDLTDYQGFPIEDRSVLGAKLYSAIKSLKMKEEIIGMNSPKSLQLISSFIATKFKNDEDFNISSISLEEQIELLGLMRKIRVNSADGVQMYNVDDAYLDFDEESVKPVKTDDKEDDKIDLSLPKEAEKEEEEVDYEKQVEELRIKKMREKLMNM